MKKFARIALAWLVIFLLSWLLLKASLILILETNVDKIVIRQIEGYVLPDKISPVDNTHNPCERDFLLNHDALDVDTRNWCHDHPEFYDPKISY